MRCQVSIAWCLEVKAFGLHMSYVGNVACLVSHRPLLYPKAVSKRVSPNGSSKPRASVVVASHLWLTLSMMSSEGSGIANFSIEDIVIGRS
jgi:hypothetical protein